MPDNQLPPVTLPRAPRGSKRDWPTVTAQVPPMTMERLLRFRARIGALQGVAVWQAIEAGLDSLDREAA